MNMRIEVTDTDRARDLIEGIVTVSEATRSAWGLQRC
jgi:hypothetical protein